MRIESLEQFLEIVRCGSITKAAEHFYISQQGLSKSIQGMEKELGVELFRKDGRKVVPTNEGLVVDSYARRIVSEYLELREMLEGPSDSVRTHGEGIRLYVMPFVSNSLFNTVKDDLGEYRIALGCVCEMSYREIVEAFSEGEARLALVNVTELDLDGMQDLVLFDPLFSSEVVAVVPKSMAGSLRSKSVTPHDLSEFPIALYNDSMLNGLIRSFFDKAGLTSVTFDWHTTNVTQIHSLVRTGKAITFRDSFSLSVQRPTEGARVFRMEPSPRFYVGFLFSRRLEKDAEEYAFARRFSLMLRNSFRTQHVIRDRD